VGSLLLWWVRAWGEGVRGGCGLALLHVCHGWIVVLSSIVEMST
jgi:hypothetical protein